MLVQVNKIKKNFGGVPLFEELSMTITEQDKVGLVGTNGTGKTTLFNILHGDEGIDSGVISQSKGLKIGYIEQKHEAATGIVMDYILNSFSEILRLKSLLSHLEQKMADPKEDFEKVLNRYGKAQSEYEQLNGYSIEDQVMGMLRGFGVADKLETKVADLSGGERVRVELAKLLVEDADLLLLDEPTNHLDLKGIRWLESYLRHFKKAFIVISHDRQFLDNVVEKVFELDDGALNQYPGNYSRYRELKKIEVENLQKNFNLQQQEIQRIKNLIRQFRQWGNENDNEKFFKKAKMYEKRLEKMTILKKPVTEKNKMRRSVSEAGKSGIEVIKADHLGKIMGEKLLFEDSSFVIYRGERIAVMGENGCGKSTFFKLILQLIQPDEGGIKIGSSVKLGYLPQKIMFSNLEQRLIQYSYSIIGNEQKAREELARFGFYASDVTKRLKDLSGGEQVRLYLLKLFQKEINLLLMDEPTNHLDIDAREEIEEILEKYSGTLLVVSHDRYFLKRVLQQTLDISNQAIIKIDKLIAIDE